MITIAHIMFQKGSYGSYGEKAHYQMKNTKGKFFKKEKTKNKRGRYAGGAVDLEVRSHQFED